MQISKLNPKIKLPSSAKISKSIHERFRLSFRINASHFRAVRTETSGYFCLLFLSLFLIAIFRREHFLVAYSLCVLHFCAAAFPFRSVNDQQNRSEGEKVLTPATFGGKELCTPCPSCRVRYRRQMGRLRRAWVDASVRRHPTHSVAVCACDRRALGRGRGWRVAIVV